MVGIVLILLREQVMDLVLIVPTQLSILLQLVILLLNVGLILMSTLTSIFLTCITLDYLFFTKLLELAHQIIVLVRMILVIEVQQDHKMVG